MTAFQQEITKILLDKVLLGLIAAGFGYYLARLLETYRAKNAYKLAVSQHYIETCRTLVTLFTEHHEHVMGLWGTLKLAAQKHPLSPEESKPGLDYCDAHAEFARRAKAILPFMTYEIADAAIAYMGETLKVAQLAKLERPATMPTDESLNNALGKFVHASASIIFHGPFESPKHDHKVA